MSKITRPFLNGSKAQHLPLHASEPWASRPFPRTHLAAPFLILFLLFALGCGAGGGTPETSSEAAASEIEASAPKPLVATARAELETWHETVELSVEMAPWASVTVAAEVAGRIVELSVEHGDRMGAGEVIARLDGATAEAELEQALARHLAAVASLEQARRDVERGRSLAGENGILSNDELDRLELAVSTGEAKAQEAAAAVLVLKERVADMEIRAPFAGTVSVRHAELGSWLGPGDPVIRLLDTRRLKARGSASQNDRVRLALENPAKIRVDALGETTFPGRLRFLGEEAEATTSTYLVEAEVAGESDGKRLLPGMRGSMTLELEEHEDVLLPRTALVDGAVFVVEGETALRRRVVSEPIGPGRMRVLEGLEEGELVVVQGQHRLADGDPVTVRPSETP